MSLTTAPGDPHLSQIPVFYTSSPSLPRASALANGAVLAATFLAGVCLLLARGGAFPSHPYSLHSQPASPAAPARARPEPVQAPIPFYFRLLAIVSALDANHDGVISAGEIASAPAALAKLDANRDGKLDADECGGQFGDEPAAAPTPDALTATLMAFDRNHDGKLERSELPERLQPLFDRAGAAPAASLTAAEIRKFAETDGAARFSPRLDPQFLQRARLAFMHIHPVLAALDADRNGEISAAEIRNAPAMLRTLDANNDGTLTVQEILPDPVSAAVAQFISIFDTDNDRELSPLEWTPAFGPRLRRTLARAGRGHGGIVTESELISQLRLASPTSYQEMQSATHKGFAALAAKAR